MDLVLLHCGVGTSLLQLECVLFLFSTMGKGRLKCTGSQFMVRIEDDAGNVGGREDWGLHGVQRQHSEF